MSNYKFETLPQLVDHRETLPKKGSYKKRKTALKDCKRAWHHSITAKALSGSNALGFAKYHVQNLGWPGIGYTFVIEPQNIIQTPKGPRARIVYCHDFSLLTYNVGNSNDWGLGICVAGDYRFEEMDEATKATIDELQDVLNQDGIGNGDLSHHEFPGYGWKACCVFDYKEVFKFLNHTPVQELPEFYDLQQGDTLWGIANNDARFTVEDLQAWNNIKDPSKVKVGQRIHFKQQSITKEPVKTTPVKVLWTGEVNVATLNIRKGPSTEFPSVKQLHRGEEVKVYEVKNQWLNIGNGQWISNVDNKYVKKVVKSSKRFLNLKPHMNSWRVYPLTVVTKIGYEKGKLNPKKFGGLSYEILGNPQKDVYTIQTSHFGKVNIYAPRDNDSTITNSKLY
ncbi:LysM peptidoglycan-binding domain-containing protein [Sutcliffiella horikoshii]|uniref:LysM peptidoglycan-binding domain-containing protein n=1 Tax=Sutcliffiella horikoshii TaxID=79883 RepID=A0A5D4SQ48_9BACI|nr:LysM peptidoglycan-binding domain-containing protein [Sutcliffiella horikoshii]TYS64474.1 LysM peptidoglycan-binding domain-containing protein [Sutcliffiella horikoshii]